MKKRGDGIPCSVYPRVVRQDLLNAAAYASEIVADAGGEEIETPPQPRQKPPYVRPRNMRRPSRPTTMAR